MHEKYQFQLYESFVYVKRIPLKKKSENFKTLKKALKPNRK